MTLHALKDCPACVLHIDKVEPYCEPGHADVRCSRCFDELKICVACEGEDDHE